MTWNAANYQDQFSYVWQHGESLMKQLNPQPGEQIVDLGCGTGQLSAQIAAQGAFVVGLDSDRAMITQAQENYPQSPQLDFQVADAANFQLPAPVDAVFSNAALHWVTEAKAAADCISKALKSGGRFVGELGGHGNVSTILAALEKVSGRADLNPWYFPTLGDYVALLERAALTVEYAHLFDRPTPLGEAGLAGWLEMFGQRFFADLSAAEWADIVSAVEAEASDLYQDGLYQDGIWVADYRRLRVVAIK